MNNDAIEEVIFAGMSTNALDAARRLAESGRGLIHLIRDDEPVKPRKVRIHGARRSHGKRKALVIALERLLV